MKQTQNENKIRLGISRLRESEKWSVWARKGASRSMLKKSFLVRNKYWPYYMPLRPVLSKSFSDLYEAFWHVTLKKMAVNSFASKTNHYCIYQCVVVEIDRVKAATTMFVAWFSGNKSIFEVKFVTTKFRAEGEFPVAVDWKSSKKRHGTNCLQYRTVKGSYRTFVCVQGFQIEEVSAYIWWRYFS